LLALTAVTMTCSVPARAEAPQPRLGAARLLQVDIEDLLQADDQILVPSRPVQTLRDPQPWPEPVKSAYDHIGDGEASYYGNELAGNRTASGERFNPLGLTAAHRTLPLGTRLRVTNKANGKSVIVRINDRGPFVGNRVIDVSLGAAREVAMVRSGKAMVRLERLR